VTASRSGSGRDDGGLDHGGVLEQDALQLNGEMRKSLAVTTSSERPTQVRYPSASREPMSPVSSWPSRTATTSALRASSPAHPTMRPTGRWDRSTQISPSSPTSPVTGSPAISNPGNGRPIDPSLTGWPGVLPTWSEDSVWPNPSRMVRPHASRTRSDLQQRLGIEAAVVVDQDVGPGAPRDAPGDRYPGRRPPAAAQVHLCEVEGHASTVTGGVAPDTWTCRGPLPRGGTAKHRDRSSIVSSGDQHGGQGDHRPGRSLTPHQAQAVGSDPDVEPGTGRQPLPPATVEEQSGDEGEIETPDDP